MVPTFACLLVVAAAAAAAPALYDHRQDGELNVRADVQNVVLLIAYPGKVSMPLDILDFLKSGNKGSTRDAAAGSNSLQERADHVMESFVEPNTPYQVEIGSRNAEGDGRAAEVVIAGRRRLETEAQAEEADSEEIKLLGATENCGPERERDPVTLACRWRRAQPEPEPAPLAASELAPAPASVYHLSQTPEVVPS